jgi:hypothetical protein
MKKALKCVKHVFHLVHLAKIPVLTIDNLLRSSSFVPSWYRATQLSYNPTQIGGRKIVDDDDISIYMPEVGVIPSLRVHSHSCLRCEPTQERGDGHRPSHSLLCRWLEFCDAISRKSSTSGGDLTDRAHDGGIEMRSGDVAFPH